MVLQLLKSKPAPAYPVTAWSLIIHAETLQVKNMNSSVASMSI